MIRLSGCVRTIALCCFGMLPLNVAAAGDERVAELYSIYCASCHDVKSAEAPEAFNAAVWKRRLAKGTDVVLANAIKGMGNMPSQGTCFECTKDDLRRLIQYMSKPK
jgi:cytochrome c5